MGNKEKMSWVIDKACKKVKIYIHKRRICRTVTHFAHVAAWGDTLMYVYKVLNEHNVHLSVMNHKFTCS